MYQREVIAKIEKFLNRINNSTLKDLFSFDTFYTAIVDHVEYKKEISFSNICSGMQEHGINKNNIFTLCKIIDYLNFNTKGYTPIINNLDLYINFKFSSYFDNMVNNLCHKVSIESNYFDLINFLNEKLNNSVTFKLKNQNEIVLHKIDKNIKLELTKDEIYTYLVNKKTYITFYGNEDDLEYLINIFENLSKLCLDIVEKNYLMNGINFILSLLSNNIKGIKIQNILNDEKLNEILNSLNITRLFQLSKIEIKNIEQNTLLKILNLLLKTNFVEPIYIQNILLSKLKEKERTYMKLRYVKYLNYNEIGIELGVTRAGAQAAISKSLRTLYSYRENLNDFYKQALLFRENDLFITNDVFYKTGIWGKLFTDLYNLNQYKDSDIFIINNLDPNKQYLDNLNIEKTEKGIYEFSFVINLPNIINKTELNKYIELVKNNIIGNISNKDIQEIISLNYYNYLSILSKSKLNNNYFFKQILENYYSNGLNVYDKEALNNVRKLLLEQFNIDISGYNDRYISARITKMCSLCGRGVWKYNSNIKLSTEMINKINKYISNYPVSSIPIKSIYDKFSVELFDFGIENKYILQGILKDIINPNYKSTKDYIFTDDTQSFVSHIEDFIKTSKQLVTKDILEKHFPGFQIGSMQRVIETTSILNMNGYYASIDNFEISVEEKEKLKMELDKIVNDGLAHNVKNIYFRFKNIFNGLFNRLGISHYLQLYYLVNKLFENEFEFLRPFIGQKNIEIQDKETQLVDLIIKEKTCSIVKIRELSSKISYFIDSIVDFVIRNNDKIIFLNKDNVAPIEEIHIDEETMIKIDTILDNFMLQCNYRYLTELCEYPAIVDLINNPNEWMLYSLISVYSTKYKIYRTSKMMSNTELLLIKEDFDTSAFDKSFICKKTNNVNLDDLLEIEDLE